MEKKLDRLSLVVGLILYLFDYGSDIYVAIQYGKNNDYWWFGITIGLIVVPSMIVNITAIIQLINIWRSILAVLQLSIVVRYIETLKSPHPSRTYFLARLRYLETITESAPQWCLQVYIMLRQWSFPSYTVVSTVLSLLSLAWSITTVEKQRKLHREEKNSLRAAVVFLIWQLSTLVSKLSAIVIVFYVFGYYAIFCIAVHWFFVTVAMIKLQQEKLSCKSFILSCLASYPSLFHSLETVLPTASPKVVMIMGHTSIVIGNMVCIVSLFLAHEIPDVRHMGVLEPVVITCIAAGTVLSMIFLIFYYHCVSVKRD